MRIRTWMPIAMVRTLSPLVFFTALLSCLICLAASDTYSESLLIKPLPDGQVYTYFEFKTLWHKDLADIQWANHFGLFPMALGKFVAQNQLQELHFSLTKGLWKHKLWGYPVRDALPGAELWAWFQPFHRNPLKGWNKVTSLLSGQFCASLNFIDKAATVEPKISLRPEGVVVGPVGNSSLFYAALPHEAVCTENLTPWKKLLPCFAKAGLATLLNAVHLFNTNYFSLALDLRPVCRTPECTETSMELVQSISVVFNPPIMFEGKQTWSTFKLLGSSLRQECALAASSKVYVDITQNDTSNPHVLQPQPSSIETQLFKDGGERKYAVYDLHQMLAASSNGKQLNIMSQYKKDHSYWLTQTPPLFATRFISGYGVSNGGIVSRITNKLSKSIKVVYMDVIPWYLRIYMHTLTITNQGVTIRPDLVYYKAAKDRNQPHQIELVITLPAKSVTELRIDFDRSYLKWTEYPPDANHGVYVGSAIISAQLDVSKNITAIPSQTMSDSFFIRIHTESLLVSLPTPDFSMPYNVICLVSTVVSLAFGPIHNLTTRRARISEDSGDEQLSIYQRLRRKFNRSNDSPVTIITTNETLPQCSELK